MVLLVDTIIKYKNQQPIFLPNPGAIHWHHIILFLHNLNSSSGAHLNMK